MATPDVFAEYAAIVAALLLLEAVLSFDNAAILAAVVRRLPMRDRRKALTYGLVGAYLLRFGAIVGAVILLENPWLKLVGGGYLLYLTLRHFIQLLRHKEQHHKMPGEGGWLRRLGVPALVATIIQIELIDLAFAIDQVIVAVAFVEEIPRPDNIILIVIASFTGILALRVAAVYLARVMDWLPLLEHMAYVAVGFVGTKLVVDYVFDIHVSNPVGLAVTFGLFGIPVLVKLVFGVPATRTGEAEAIAAPLSPVSQAEPDRDGPGVHDEPGRTSDGDAPDEDDRGTSAHPPPKP